MNHDINGDDFIKKWHKTNWTNNFVEISSVLNALENFPSSSSLIFNQDVRKYFYFGIIFTILENTSILE